MACKQNIILTPVFYGDTWDGLSNCSFSSNGSAFGSNLTSIRMFFKDYDGVTGLELTTANSNITIDNATAWEFTVNPITNMPLSVGMWFWSIETTDAESVRKTRVFGTLEILDHATR
tara:strand:- start:248 stop:598 length:351 start_codon:yes stop_codon:yes gene_type:complete